MLFLNRKFLFYVGVHTCKIFFCDYCPIFQYPPHSGFSKMVRKVFPLQLIEVSYNAYNTFVVLHRERVKSRERQEALTRLGRYFRYADAETEQRQRSGKLRPPYPNY